LKTQPEKRRYEDESDPGGIGVPVFRVRPGSSPESRAEGKNKSKTANKNQPKAEDNNQPRTEEKDQSKADGKNQSSEVYKPTNDIEEIAWKHGTKAVNKELETMQDRCGFTIPVEIVYAVPMKAWVGAEEWGAHRGCTEDARIGGCVNLTWCGSEIVSQLWFSGCGHTGEGTKTEYKGWNSKVKRLICRGEGPVPGTSHMDSKYSKMKASLSKDGTLTVTLHPSDANISPDFWEYLRPRIEVD
jgi:hypothetical protein